MVEQREERRDEEQTRGKKTQSFERPGRVHLLNKIHLNSRGTFWRVGAIDLPLSLAVIFIRALFHQRVLPWNMKQLNARGSHTAGDYLLSPDLLYILNLPLSCAYFALRVLSLAVPRDDAIMNVQQRLGTR